MLGVRRRGAKETCVINQAQARLKYIPVGGTGARSRHNAFIHEGSVFDLFMAEHGYDRLALPDGRMFWSGGVDGTFFSVPGHPIWRHGADSLAPFILEQLYKDRILILHSHAGQVGAYAFRKIAEEHPGERIRAAITYDSPVRRDMDETWAIAETVVDLHIHVYGTGWGSRMRFLGQRARFARTFPPPAVNKGIKGGHSGGLRKWKFMDQLESKILVPVRATSEVPSLEHGMGSVGSE